MSVWNDERKWREERPTESEEWNKENDQSETAFVPVLLCVPEMKIKCASQNQAKTIEETKITLNKKTNIARGQRV